MSPSGGIAMVTEGRRETTGVIAPERGGREVGMGVEMDKVGRDRIHHLEVGGRGMNLEQMGQMKGREMNKSCGIGGEKPTEGLRTGSRMQVTETILENKTTG